MISTLRGISLSHSKIHSDNAVVVIIQKSVVSKVLIGMTIVRYSFKICRRISHGVSHYNWLSDDTFCFTLRHDHTLNKGIILINNNRNSQAYDRSYDLNSIFSHRLGLFFLFDPFLDKINIYIFEPSPFL